MDAANDSIRVAVVEHMDYVSKWTGTDLFLLRPKQPVTEEDALKGVVNHTVDNRLRIAIFGDSESSEHAKTRILIMIDQIVRWAWTDREDTRRLT